MKYNLLQKCRGKSTVVMTDVRSKVNDRLKTLRDSVKFIGNNRVEYSIVPAAEDDEKFKKAPATQWKNYNRGGPKKV
jgi:hypothetical protein